MEQAFFRAAQARAQAAVLPQSDLFDIQKIADGVYAAIARPKTIINCNAAIFENANDLLIVDAHSKPSAAAALVSQIKRGVTQKPIRYIVNTHFHWDHTQGDPAYRRLAPEAHFVSSSATRELLAQFGTQRATQSKESAAAAVEKSKRQLEDMKPGPERNRIERGIAETQAYVAEMKGYKPELPDITFDRSLILHDKAHDLHLAFSGRGHTAGDVVVFCPQRKVIATGDLLHGWFPFIGDGYPREWPKTLSAVSEFPFDTVVGGHGAVQHGKRRLTQKSAYITELTGLVEKGKHEGKSSQELQGLIKPMELKSLDEDYKSFLVSQNSNPSVTARMYVENGVKSNVADIYARLDAVT